MENQSHQNNPWKWSFLIAVIGIPLITLAFAVAARMLRGDPEEEVAAPARAPARVAAAPAARPPPALIEDCNRYAATARDNGHILQDGVIGGAVGAGAGAAGGAIADGGSGAGKGAGIGAVVGAVGGALYGLTEENKKSERAREAYAECIARRG
jgi:uncharacterized protein YcfJ